MYSEHSYVNETRYCVRPSVVRDNYESTMRITRLDPVVDFQEGDVFEMRILPKDYLEGYAEKESEVYGKEKTCEMEKVTVKGGAITFKYSFYGCQEWIIYLKKENDSETEWYWTDSFPKTRARLSVYCLNDALYGSIPMKGDLHIHTRLSDGGQSPEFNAAAYREAGFDFIAITDHHKFNDGKALSAFFSFANPLVILPGEEVHEKSSAILHLISIGANRCISDLLQNSPEDLQMRLLQIKEKYPVPEGIYAEEYLIRALAYEEIKKSGGYAIYPHPFWQLPEHYHAELKMSRAALENHLADAFEVFGGCTPEGMDLQACFYHSLQVKDLPVVGSSDSHTVLPGATAFDEIYTVCLVKDSIVNSINERKSVAVYAPREQFVRTCGDFECTKYVRFLLRCYFPKHNLLCKKSGELLKKYVEGDASVKEDICLAEREIREFGKDFFGYDLLY